MTTQLPEILIHRGQKLNLCEQPLYDYLRRLRKRRRPKFLSWTTACHRGYVATWEIIDNKLYLRDLEGVIARDGEAIDADLKTALPWLKPPLFAKWVSGDLRGPEGRLVNYTHHGYSSKYERDRLFYVENGHILGEWLTINPPEPIHFRINNDGSRSCVEGLYLGANEIDDPFGPDTPLEGWRAWGKAPEYETGDETYFIAAAYNFQPRVPENNE